MDKRRKRSFFQNQSPAFRGNTPRRPFFPVQPREYSKLLICGYDVKLPEKLQPYRAQRTMIAKVLTSLKNRLNALLESPTGSGKTLALLSSTCAWLAKYKEERIKSKVECRACNGRSEASTSNVFSSVDSGNFSEPPQDEVQVDAPTTPLQKILTAEEEYDDDFVSSFQSTPSRQSGILSIAPKKMKLDDPAEPDSREGHTCLPRVTIYYGTRTHKQIGQVVKEYSRLPYGHNNTLKHTILGSREHSCINRQVRESGADMQAKCLDLIGPKGSGCPFKESMRPKYERPGAIRQLTSQNLQRPDDVWDMEDLVKALSESTPPICPYFSTTRVLTQDADIVFCPFNYMIDPIIRDNSDVSLKNAVIVLDEAHNVEDVCREAASFSFTEKEVVSSCIEFRSKAAGVEKALSKLRNNVKANQGVDDYEAERNRAEVDAFHQLSEDFKTVCGFMSDVLKWFAAMSTEALERAPPRGERWALTSSWETLYTSLRDHSLLRFEERGSNGPLMSLIKALTGTCGNNGNTNLDGFKPASSALVCAEKFIYFFKMYFVEDHKTCYKLFICIDKPAESQFRFGSNFEKSVDVLDMSVHASGEDQWLDSRAPLNGYREVKPGYRVNFQLWCMRPALAYLDAFSQSRSVILASGTLCPMDTFKSELGVQFHQQMEGTQVIPDEQIFAAVVPSGPTAHHLRMTYRNINEDDQLISELALVIRAVCERVPKGVLCFVASYRLLERLYQYMESSGTLRQIMTIKHVVREPRRSAQLNEIMAEYEKAIDFSEQYGPHCTGALMFAVFRGKVSEGIDFADDRARCVISVGIPFPNAMDEQVMEKKLYNNENCKKLGLLSGDDWYTMQAYRALNQALGRCLRHRNDWGVILLVDDRLLQNSSNPHSTKVSRWIREQLRRPSSYRNFLLELSKFITKMQTPDVPEGAGNDSGVHESELSTS